MLKYVKGNLEDSRSPLFRYKENIVVIAKKKTTQIIKFFWVFVSLMLSPPGYTKAATIVISIDGFSNEFLDIHKPPFLTKMRKEGAYAPLAPVYPSKTFPNHLTMVTGKHPFEHGIVHNSFFRKDLNSTYSLGAGKEQPKWLTARPIWSIAEEKGIKTGIYFWPESETEYDKFLPSFVKSYDGKIPNDERLNQIIEWLSLPDLERPELILTYFSTLDSAAHEFGLSSAEVADAIEEIDDLLETFSLRLKKELDIPVNLVIVSDHGVVEINQKDIILINEILKPYIALENLKVVQSETQVLIYSEDQRLLKELAKNINKAKGLNSNHFGVYFPSEMPKSWNYHHSTSGLPDLLIEAKVGYVFENKRGKYGKATHGYDPISSPQLDAVFLATGPNFKNVSTSKFSNRYVFNILAEILKLELPESTCPNFVIPNEKCNFDHTYEKFIAR